MSADFRFTASFPLTLFALVGAVALLGAGCAGTQPPEEGRQEGGDGAPRYERHVYAIPVHAPDGTPYAHPFLGGLNYPRPQFVDIDADGDADLFVQEQAGGVMFFENQGTATTPQFRWQTDTYRDLPIGEWYRFYDADKDGDLDLFTEKRFSHISYFRNDGTPEVPNFVMVTDSVQLADEEPFFADRQNIPFFTDIDCDGMTDLFVGQVTGTLKRYESVGLDSDGVPRFALVTDRFEDIEIVAQINMGSRHGANAIAFIDYDSDGDEDLFWGDFFEPGLLLIQNTGTCEAPDLRNEPLPFPRQEPVLSSGYNVPYFADVDGDGQNDLFIGVLGGAFNANATTIANFIHLEETDGTFGLETRQYLTGLDVGSEAFASFGDLDADGDPDLLVGNKIDPTNNEVSYLFHYENIGTAADPAFQRVDTLDLLTTFHKAPALGDLDADGDLDMILGSWKEGMAYYRNDGTPQEPRFTLVSEKYIELTRGSNATPALADLDADGDLDLMIGESSGSLNYYRNDGTPQAPQFVLVSDEYGDIDIGRRSAPAFTDWDGDGDLDLIVGSDADGIIRFENTGTKETPVFVDRGPLPVPFYGYAAPRFVDIDADGDADLFIAHERGGLLHYEAR